MNGFILGTCRDGECNTTDTYFQSLEEARTRIDDTLCLIESKVDSDKLTKLNIKNNPKKR